MKQKENVAIVPTAVGDESLGKTRPELAGQRVRDTETHRVYLVNPEGQLQLIPDIETYNMLFLSREETVMDTRSLAFGPPLTCKTALARGNNPNIYLISNGMKRWVRDPQSMNRSHFSWGKIRPIPDIALEIIASGNDWVIPKER